MVTRMTTETQVSTLLKEYARTAPDSDFTVDAWTRGRTRRRNQRLTGVVAVVAATAVVVVAYAGIDASLRTDSVPAVNPTPTPSSTAEPKPQGGPVTAEMVQEAWKKERFETLEWYSSSLPRLLNPDWDSALPLSSNPMGRAVAAIERDVRSVPQISVLADDGVWRRIDIGDLVQTRNLAGYTGTALQPSSISPDQTQLAIPQPKGLVIIDLTTGTAEQFDSEGFSQTVAWSPDGGHVLVGKEGRERGVLVELKDGSTRRVPFTSAYSAFQPKGTAIQLAPSVRDPEMQIYGVTGDTQTIPLKVGAQFGLGSNLTLSANDETMAMVGYPVPGPPGRVEGQGGPLVMSALTGDPIAMIPMRNYGTLYSTGPLGWLNEETVIFRIGTDVVAWTYETGELQRLTQTIDSPLGTGAGGFSTLALAPQALQ